MCKLLFSVATFFIFGTGFVFGTDTALSAELLPGGDFEPQSSGGLVGWSLDGFATGTGTTLSTSEQVDFAAESGDFGLFLKPFTGGMAPGPDNLTNAILSQTVAGVAGETYEFKGSSRWEQNYAGGVTTLDATSPLGAAPSPTNTTMRLSFLDASGSVLGSPVELDLRTEQTNFDFWVEHSLNGVAPAGTASVRVTAEATDMVWNVDPMQAAFYDSFSLTASGAPATNVLTNGGLDDLETGLEAWTITSNEATGVEAAGFANNTPSGSVGAWLRPFLSADVDAELSQTVPATEGGMYTFSGSSLFEANYSGGTPSATETFFELAFLDGSDMEIGTPLSVDLRTEQMNDATWRQHSVGGVAPAGTVSVRVTAAMINGFATTGAQSLFFDDFSLDLTSVSLPGDFGSDGDVDGSDFLLWQRGESPNGGDAGDLALWEANYGAANSPLAANVVVPEPATAISLALSILVLGVSRSRRQA